MRVLLAGAICALAVAAAGEAHAQDYVWDMPNEYPAPSVQGDADRFFAEKLREKSDGRIEIVHHFGASLGFRSRDQLDAVADGAVVLANTYVSPLGGFDPIFLAPTLPFLASTTDEAELLYYASKPFYEKALEPYNQKLLFSSPWPQGGIWANAPADSMDAISGLKVRTYDVNGTQIFQKAGAQPVQLSWADIVSQLSTGGIDGVITSIEGGMSAGFDDYLSHFTVLGFDAPLNFVTMNLDIWNSLPEDLQVAIEEAALETEEHMWANIAGVVDRRYEAARERGVTVVLDLQEGYREEFSELAEPMIQEWVETVGPDAEALLADYRSRTAEISN